MITENQLHWRTIEFMNDQLCSKAGTGRPIEVPEGVTTGELQFIMSLYSQFDVAYDASTRTLTIGRPKIPTD